MPHRRGRQPLIATGRTVILALAWVCLADLASATPQSQERLRQLMDSAARPEASAPVPGPATADTVAERQALLRQGEEALARTDVEAAEDAFGRAALIQHAADSELGLVRTYMQAGQYRRALAFGAHTAGAHLDVVGGAALYAWLLQLGGQEGVARQLMAQARARAPAQPLLGDVTAQLATPAPRASGDMLSPPARLAPYAGGPPLPAGAAVVGSGTLVGDGHYAIVPAQALTNGGRYWVRNGLGQTRPAQLAGVYREQGIALLRLAQALPSGSLTSAPADAFPGSVSHAVQYPLSADAAPAWPVMHTGFMGAALDSSGGRKLDLGLATDSPGAGPVFDQAARLVGVAVHAKGADRLVPAARLRKLLGARLAVPPSDQAGKRAPDAIYEPALRVTLQLIAHR